MSTEHLNSVKSVRVTHRYRVTLYRNVERALHHSAIARSITIPEVIAEAVEQYVRRDGWLNDKSILALNTSTPTISERTPEDSQSETPDPGAPKMSINGELTTKGTGTSDAHVATTDEMLAEIGFAGDDT